MWVGEKGFLLGGSTESSGKMLNFLEIQRRCFFLRKTAVEKVCFYEKRGRMPEVASLRVQNMQLNIEIYLEP